MYSIDTQTTLNLETTNFPKKEHKHKRDPRPAWDPQTPRSRWASSQNLRSRAGFPLDHQVYSNISMASYHSCKHLQYKANIHMLHHSFRLKFFLIPLSPSVIQKWHLMTQVSKGILGTPHQFIRVDLRFQPTSIGKIWRDKLSGPVRNVLDRRSKSARHDRFGNHSIIKLTQFVHSLHVHPEAAGSPHRRLTYCSFCVKMLRWSVPVDMLGSSWCNRG